MALNAAEEESIEAVRKWWDENGKFLITVVVCGAVIWGGWTFWQSSRNATADAASDLYEEILVLVAVEPGTEVSTGDSARVMELAQELKSDHSASVYALYGALFSAQQAVTAGDLDSAEQELQWLLDNTKDGMFSRTDEGLILTANLRLGRVILAMGDSQRALDLIDGINPRTFEADFAELRGDIYVDLGRTVEAKDVYTAAQQAGSSSAFLQMKLDELASDG